MIPLFTAEQVRAMDARTIAGGVPSLALMERAAGHLARAVVGAADHAYGLRVAVLCGKGNNGGDGIAAARRLRAEYGAAPTVCLVAGEDELSGDAAEQLRRWEGRVAAGVEAALRGADIAVDCLLGTGARGEPRPPYDAAIAVLDDFDGTVVACDVPSGVDADSGDVPGLAVRADVTVTLGARKRGLALWPARGHVGKEVLGALGTVAGDDQPVAWALEAGDVAHLVPPPPPDADKRSRGVVVVLAGAPGMSGAATLVGRGALAAGAGLVTVATAARDLVAPTVPEALTLAVPHDDPDVAFERVAAALDGADALAVGPGLGHDEPARELVRRLVREVDVPIVLDADGLNVFRHEGDLLADHRAALLVCTPHLRELARLVGAPAAAQGDRVHAQRVTLVPEKAQTWDAVVVAKGPGSVTAAPDGRVWINPTGSAALATGGTGDVLTGLTATLVAQSPVPESVAAAVYVHGLAGELAGAAGALRSVTALDVAAHLPHAFAALEAAR